MLGLKAWLRHVNNVTFSGNRNIAYGTTTPEYGGNDLYVYEGTCNVNNTIIDSLSNGNSAIGGDLTACTIKSSLLPGAFPAGATDGGGNILHGNPLFVDTAAGNYELYYLSPAINAGNNSLVDPTITTDLAANPRIVAGTVDVGAYENQCTAPWCSCVYTFTGTDTVGFTYTGTTGYDSVRWSFGDGGTGTSPSPTHIYTASGTYTVCITIYTICGIDSSCHSVTVVVHPSGLSAEALASLAVYPNPTVAELNVVNAPAGTVVKLCNAMGQQVYYGVIQNTRAQINTRALAPGSYILQLTDPAGNRVNKIVEKE